MNNPYFSFVLSLQALRLKAESFKDCVGGALGAFVVPYPYQTASVERVLSDIKVRHLIADEVGMGKTAQALMILNALKYQNRNHKAVIIVPEKLIKQWEEEILIKGHRVAVTSNTKNESIRLSDIDSETCEIDYHQKVTDFDTSILLTRPEDYIKDNANEGNESKLEVSELFDNKDDDKNYDLLILDEPQTYSVEVLRRIKTYAGKIKQIIILSATPPLTDDIWEMIEPYRTDPQDFQKFNSKGFVDPIREKNRSLVDSGLRRVIRNSRKDWGEFLPSRKVRIIETDPIKSERLRAELSFKLLRTIDKSIGSEIIEQEKYPITVATALLSTRNRFANLRSDIREVDYKEAASEIWKSMESNYSDARIETLIDLLSGIWYEAPNEKVIIVVGYDSSIDYVEGKLKDYFPYIQTCNIRRSTTKSSNALGAMEDSYENLGSFIDGGAKILLLSDTVDAGLNLHLTCNKIVFYSLPWNYAKIDQLIGRVDRVKPFDKKARGIDVWAIIQPQSPEQGIVKGFEAISLFEKPMAPISDIDKEFLQSNFLSLLSSCDDKTSLEKVIDFSNKKSQNMQALNETDPQHSFADIAKKKYSQLKSQHLIGPLLEGENLEKAFYKRREQAIENWFKLIKANNDFQIGYGIDYFNQKLKFGIFSINRYNNAPFLIESIDRKSEKYPYILSRKRAVEANTTSVNLEGENMPKILRFFDFGDEIFDELVEKYISLGTSIFGEKDNIRCVDIIISKDHVLAKMFGGKTYLYSANYFDANLLLDEKDYFFDTVKSEIQKFKSTSRSNQLSYINALYRDMYFADCRWLLNSLGAGLFQNLSVLNSGNWYMASEREKLDLFKVIDERKIVKTRSRFNENHYEINNKLRSAINIHLGRSKKDLGEYLSELKQVFCEKLTERLVAINTDIEEFEAIKFKEISKMEIELEQDLASNIRTMKESQKKALEKELEIFKDIKGYRLQSLGKTYSALENSNFSQTWNCIFKFIIKDDEY